MLRIALMVSIFTFSFAGKTPAIDRYDAYFVRAAILFALIAEWFLVVNETYEIFCVGILSFCVCQTLHFLRTAGFKSHLKYLVALPVVFFILPRGVDIVTRCSIIYIICLASAVYGGIRAFLAKKYDAPNRHFIVTAMAFFVISDVSVLLYNAPALKNYQELTLYFIWCFCLPAHVLMSLSKIKLR